MALHDQQSIVAAAEEVAQERLDGRHEHWNVSFALARRLRALLQEPIPSEAPVDVVELAVEAFCEFYNEGITRLERTRVPVDPSDLAIGVLAKWDKVRVEEGHDALDVAAAQAEASDVELFEPLPRLVREDERLRGLVGIAHFLQEYQEDDPIVLPVERLGDLLGIHHTNVGSRIQVLVKVGMLTVARPHSFGKPKVKNRAAEYKFKVGHPAYRLTPPSRDDADPAPLAVLPFTAAAHPALVPEVLPPPRPTRKRRKRELGDEG